MNGWILKDSPEGLYMDAIKWRSFGSEKFTWAHLFYKKLASLKVFIVYFPSRFDSEVDIAVKEILQTFAKNTGSTTLVNYWNPKDPEFDQALSLFGLNSPPALVITTGLSVINIEPFGPENAKLYSLAIDKTHILGNANKLMSTLNYSHQIFAQGDPQKIRSFIRTKSVESFLEYIFDIVNGFSCVIPKCKLILPDKSSIEVGYDK